MRNQKANKTAGNRIKFAFVLGVAAILVVAIAIVVILEYLLIQSRLVEPEQVENNGLFMIIMFGVASVTIGLVLAFILGRVVFKPINSILEGMEKLSEGEFSHRIYLDKYEGMKNFADTFNKLAVELQSTEILRSDFVNNFSHELKTPIVSVSGLIGLMKNDELPKDKRKKYLRIIEEEVNRLSEMTTNMLNLSRVERQEILTDKTTFNVSEQIRNCVLLLEKKWTKKKLEFSLDFGEYFISANEDMLKQVWFNLLDNAIKFSNEGKEIKIELNGREDNLYVSIENDGAEITENDKQKIFNKFYRGENSSSGEGNGIGLSIVKRIIDLHGGTIEFDSVYGKTKFKVTLSKM